MTSAASLRGLTWALGLLGVACAAPGFHGPPVTTPDLETSSSPATPTREAAAPRAPTVRRAAGQVTIQLGALAGREVLVVHDGLAGETTLTREGDAVRVGGSSRPSWLLHASPGSPGLRIDKTLYAGRLRVSARAAGGLEVQALMDLEEYVAGVVAAELVVWSAPAALLEAQAIAARSYAVAELDHRARAGGRPYLFDDTRDQAFGGSPGVAGRGAEAVRAAVERTRGRVLLEGESVLDARYHAACGGRTAEGARVFPESDFASLSSVACSICAASQGELAWKTTAARRELDLLARSAGLIPPLVEVAPAEVDEHGRWLNVRLRDRHGEAVIGFTALREALGAKRVASSLVTSTWPPAGQPIENGLFLAGRGRGHGVGLCQTGARGLAEAGWSAERILAHYYPGAVLVDGR
jgi:stage II sporulation protein D